MNASPRFFSCARCPAYCCSYPRIVVGKRDLERLAKHFRLDFDAARETITEQGHGKRERILKHKPDETFGTVCRFLDTEKRQCTVYKARPKICREFPGTARCGYYDFLASERRALEDEDHISTTWNHPD